MKMNLKKGFTLIELLVVVAIIGILASVVLGSLTSGRDRAKATAVQATLANMRAQAELYYSTAGNYGTVYNAAFFASGGASILPATTCTTNATNVVDTNMWGVANATTGALGTLLKGACSSGATAITGAVDAATATKWAVTAAAPGGNFYCVDSSGASKSSTSTITIAAGVTCP